ncbi:MAG: thiamine-phosphate kinase [Candidatus Calescibacterium sp.]|jgi:thiamine-monophosphate kinase|nr:thiamine-phosphate kinase [Candidatus Calescibacterium sp.]
MSEIERIIELGKRLGWILNKSLMKNANLPYFKKLSTPWGSDSLSINVGNFHIVMSSDQSVERTHFDLKFMTPYEVGQRALRCAVSDIVCTASEPSFAFVNLAGRDYKVLEKIGEGIIESAEEVGLKLAGGDTSKSYIYSISIFVVGYSKKKPLSRFGAHPGDHIHITGTVGDSALALEVLKKKGRGFAEKYIPYALQKFLKPPLRKKVIQKIKRFVKFSADASDGPLRTVEWICALNNVSCEFFPERVPFSEEFLRFAPKFFKDPQSISITYGDDYEIVFGTSEEKSQSMRKYGEIIGIVLSDRDVKRALQKNYPFKKISSVSGKKKFIFFTYKKPKEFFFEHF